MVVDEDTNGDLIVDSGPQGPMRLCAVSRLPRPAHELIRFVAGPDGSIVPDPAGKLPGRGVWIASDRDTLAQGIKANVFAKSLKRQVRIAAELPDLVEKLLKDRSIQALSLANKAGLAVAGYQQVEGLIEAGEASILLHGLDGSEGGSDKLNRKFVAIQREKGLEARILGSLTIQQMSLAMGRANVVHAALKSGGVAEKFWGEAKRLERYVLGTRPAMSIATTDLKKV